MDEPATERNLVDSPVLRALAAADAAVTFGPGFFLVHLAAFVREQCPSPSEGLPAVELGLRDGTIVRICHVITVAPRWVALATHREGDDVMQTELVAFEMIVRVRQADGHAGIGFDAGRRPRIVSAEAEKRDGTAAEALLEAASSPTGG